MIIVHIAMGIPICTLLMRNFFATVPNALREAAIVEGANEWQVLTRVALPISLPALAVLAHPCSSPGSGTTSSGR